MARRYDLHPVVGGYAAGGLKQEEKERYGQGVVDYFSARGHRPYDDAESLDDLRDGIQVVRTLLEMGRHQQAARPIKKCCTRSYSWRSGTSL